MVLVQPPPGASPPDRAAAEEHTARGTSPAEVSPPPAPQAADPAARPGRSTRFREDFSPSAIEPAQRTSDDDDAGIAIARPPKAGTQAVAVPPLSTDSSSPLDETGVPPRWHRVVLLVGAAAAGIILALLVVGWLAGRRPADAPAGAPPTKPVAAAPPGTDESFSADTPTAPAPAAHTEVAEAVQADDSSSVDADPDLPGQIVPPADGEASAAPQADPARTSPPASDMAGEGTPAGAEPDDAPIADEAAAPAPPAAVPALDISLVAIDLQGMPLVDFADFVADFTGLPVSLDLPAMAVAQISPGTPLDVQRERLTMDALLHAVLASIEMKHVVRDGQMVFTPVSVPETPWETTYEVADLAVGEHDVQALGELITALVAPSSWVAAGGTATLTTTATSLQIQQDAPAHVQIAQLLDRLRAARGLAPRGGSTDVSLDPTPALAEAARALSTPVSSDCPSPTPVSRVLAGLRAQTDLHLVVDWRATATASWLPATDTALTCTNQPLADVLDAWLGAYHLAFRVCDAQTVEITTREAIEQRPEVAVYPLELAAGEDPTAVLGQVRAALQAAGVSADTVARAVRLDAPSRSLLVSLPQPQQRILAAQLAATGRLRTTGPAPPEDAS
jgi:hypothetical protein